jgi:hypothetical protein
MQQIKGFKDIWKKKIPFIDRLLFALMLMIISGIYLGVNFIQKQVPFSEYRWWLLGTIALILLIACTEIPGGWIVKCWLTISSLMGKFIFFVFLFLVYFLVISPLFMIRNFFKRSKIKIDTNWKEPMVNKDYLNMG